MTVFVVMRGYDYEGDTLLDVFATEEAGAAFALKEADQYGEKPEPWRPSAAVLRFPTPCGYVDVVRCKVRP